MIASVSAPASSSVSACMTTTEATMSSSPISHYAFPRTGKRGVPQQFPRRLYEMLEAEAAQLHASEDHPRIISWSESGRAFRIYDVTEFSRSILPKYFRTKKFSSFQRNLNLYGFAKVRRGPECDMYAHPSFLREKPESLVSLRKTINGARTKRSGETSPDDESYATDDTHLPVNLRHPVSPSSTSCGCVSRSHHFEQNFSSPNSVQQMVVAKLPGWPSLSSSSSASSSIEEVPASSSCPPSSPRPIIFPRSDRDRGKLDLLALALERASALSSSA